MKTLTIIALLLTTTISAEEMEQNKLQLKGSWETAVSSIYLGPEGMIIHDKPIVENSLTIQFGETGLSAGVWTALPLQKASVPKPANNPSTVTSSQPQSTTDSANGAQTPSPQPTTPAEQQQITPSFDGEIDLFTGWEKTMGPIKLTTRLAYWMVSDLSKPDDDIWSANLKLSVPDCPIAQPFVEVEHVGEVGKLSPKRGNFLFAGLTRSQSLGFKFEKAEKTQKLDLELRSAWSDGAWGMEPAMVYTRITASTDIQVSKSWHITPQVLYQFAGPHQEGATNDYVDSDKLTARIAMRVDF